MSSNRIACIIPARYNSTRLPGKPLLTINGLPLIMWVYHRAFETQIFDEIIVATDDCRIKEIVNKYGGNAILTFGTHETGTDRVNEAAQILNCSHIVNLQGDEPLIPKSLLKQICQVTLNSNNNTIITAATKILNTEINDSSNVKVVLNKNKKVLNFSRKKIPNLQCHFDNSNFKHIGIYGFSIESLQSFCSFPRGPLEKSENIELLRALENNLIVDCIITEESSIGIDTEKDLIKFRNLVNNRNERKFYASAWPS